MSTRRSRTFTCRRDTILDATLAAAAVGGYEAVQMRAVAEQVGIAVGTLYRYFPSKTHLLVSALTREFQTPRRLLRLVGRRRHAPAAAGNAHRA